MYRNQSEDTPNAPKKWPLERVLFALAGSVALIGALLTATVSKWFLLLVALVGINQWAYVLLGNCPASLILKRRWSLESVIYPEPACGLATDEKLPENTRAAR